MPAFYLNVMKHVAFILLALALGSASVAEPGRSRKGDDQGKAREQMNSGKVLSLREIEGRVVPRMRGMEYLGPEYDGSAQVYRLKFINSGRVIFVDVDARSGGIIRQR
ncbi:MAG: PepSY domain-containing protein [Sphingorhabdus sp.]